MYLLFGMLILAFFLSSCKDDSDSVGMEPPTGNAPPVQKNLVPASFSFKNGEGDIRDLTSEQLMEYYIKIVGLSAEIDWNDPEIIEQNIDSLGTSLYYIRTESSDGTKVIATELQKEGSSYLLINDPEDPVKSCTCESDECQLSGCSVTSIDPCSCSHCFDPCKKTSTWTEGRSALGFFREISKNTL